jgi:hypothetical protein
VYASGKHDASARNLAQGDLAADGCINIRRMRNVDDMFENLLSNITGWYLFLSTYDGADERAIKQGLWRKSVNSYFDAGLRSLICSILGGN